MRVKNEFKKNFNGEDIKPGEVMIPFEYTKHNNENCINKGLTNEEKHRIKEKTGWSDDIIDFIGSMEETQIYLDARLQEAEIDGKRCLIRDDIDMNQKNEEGISNGERMEGGRPPFTNDGQEIELHHIGQKIDSPLAELTTQEHRGVGNDTILHSTTKESEIDRVKFACERKRHWKARAEDIKNIDVVKGLGGRKNADFIFSV